jgi:hypothetical protein
MWCQAHQKEEVTESLIFILAANREGSYEQGSNRKFLLLFVGECAVTFSKWQTESGKDS